jgi:integrase/recombinase XerD
MKKNEKGIERARRMRRWADKKSPGRKHDDGLDRSEPDNMASLHDVWLRWMIERNLSQSAVTCRRQAIAEFLRWAAERDVSRVEQVNRPILESYQRYLWRRKGRCGKPLAMGTQLQRLGAIQSFFSWLVKQHHLEANPASDLELPRDRARRLPRGFKREEIASIMAMPDISDALGVRDRAILELLYATGIRRQELTGIDFDDLDRAADLLTIRHGKGDRERLVPVGARALHWLDRYLEEVRPRLEYSPLESAFFLTGYGERFSPGSLSHLVSVTIQKAGIEGRGSCHRFRHACATHMLKGGADSRFIQQLLGHASAETTAIYTAVDITLLREIHAKTHPSAAEGIDPPSGGPEKPGS